MPTQKNPPKQWQLNYILPKATQIIIRGTYALCVHEMNKLERSNNYKYGKLKIVWSPQ